MEFFFGQFGFAITIAMAKSCVDSANLAQWYFIHFGKYRASELLMCWLHGGFANPYFYRPNSTCLTVENCWTSDGLLVSGTVGSDGTTGKASIINNLAEIANSCGSWNLTHTPTPCLKKISLNDPNNLQQKIGFCILLPTGPLILAV